MVKHCKTCECAKQPVIEDFSRNGVKVKKYTWPDGNTSVQADCQCFGYDFRMHSRMDCPNRLRIVKENRSRAAA